jgi:hypothetical protein
LPFGGTGLAAGERAAQRQPGAFGQGLQQPPHRRFVELVAAGRTEKPLSGAAVEALNDP